MEPRTYTMSGRYPHDDEQISAIRQRMAALRKELNTDVNDVSRTAREMTDWHSYVRRFPWASLAVAAAAGYCLVPKRRVMISPDPDDLAKMAKEERLIFTQSKKARAKDSMLGKLLALAATGAARAAIAYVGQQIGTKSAQANEPPQYPTSPSANQSPQSEW